MSLSTRRRATALGMAGLYALLAMAGQGLHGLTHGVDGFCDHAAQVSDCGSCCCEHHPSAPAPRDAQGGDDRSHAAFRAPGVDGHDPHNCGVCSLLAKLKVGHGPAPAQTTVSAAPADYILSVPSTDASTVLSTLGARGPPAAA